MAEARHESGTGGNLLPRARTHSRIADPPERLLFDSYPLSFTTSVVCYDIAATPDGHVLLAGVDSGLLVYSNSGQHLHTWKPAKQSNGKDDLVWCVAALRDGRAAVAVQHAQLVVLLKRCETTDEWQEERRVTVPKSSPCRLAVHGDFMAVSYFLTSLQKQGQINCDRLVTLHDINSGTLLRIHSRDYTISRIALTDQCILTVGHGTEVVDAFSHSETFLWRYKADDNELLCGLCVTVNNGNLVYLIANRNDYSSGKVVALRLADGKKISEVLSDSRLGLPLLKYVSLSEGQQRTFLAFLSRDRVTVILYDARATDAPYMKPLEEVHLEDMPSPVSPVDDIELSDFLQKLAIF